MIKIENDAALNELNTKYRELQHKMTNTYSKQEQMETIIEQQNQVISNLQRTLKKTESRLAPNEFDFSSLISPKSPFPYNVAYLTDFIVSIYDQSKRVHFNSDGVSSGNIIYDTINSVSSLKRNKEHLRNINIAGNETPDALNIGDCLNFKVGIVDDESRAQLENRENRKGWIEFLLRDTIVPTRFEYLHVSLKDNKYSSYYKSKILESKPSYFTIYGRKLNQSPDENVKIGQQRMNDEMDSYIVIDLTAMNANYQAFDIIRVEFTNNYLSSNFICKQNFLICFFSFLLRFLLLNVLFIVYCLLFIVCCKPQACIECMLELMNHKMATIKVTKSQFICQCHRFC